MSMLKGRIIAHEKDRYRIMVEDQEISAVTRGKFQHEAVDATDYPVIGDIVEYSMTSETAVIERIEPRRTLLKRKGADRKGVQPIAANIDYVFIATSLNMDLNRSRMDRYLTLVRDSGAQPVIVLTKSDLKPEVDDLKAQVAIWFPGVDVRAIGLGGNFDELKSYLIDDASAVVVGSSGVGKSTLINALIGSNKLKTSEIREGDDKGRHTTTARSMHRAHEGWLIDTPGIRELQMLDHEEGLQEAFEDIQTLAETCKFGNCGHVSEPGCAIKRAIESGALARERWDSFLKLQREIAAQARKRKR